MAGSNGSKVLGHLLVQIQAHSGAGKERCNQNGSRIARTSRITDQRGKTEGKQNEEQEEINIESKIQSEMNPESISEINPESISEINQEIDLEETKQISEVRVSVKNKGAILTKKLCCGGCDNTVKVKPNLEEALFAKMKTTVGLNVVCPATTVEDERSEYGAPLRETVAETEIAVVKKQCRAIDVSEKTKLKPDLEEAMVPKVNPDLASDDDAAESFEVSMILGICLMVREGSDKTTRLGFLACKSCEDKDLVRLDAGTETRMEARSRQTRAPRGGKKQDRGGRKRPSVRVMCEKKLQRAWCWPIKEGDENVEKEKVRAMATSCGKATKRVKKKMLRSASARKRKKRSARRGIRKLGHYAVQDIGPSGLKHIGDLMGLSQSRAQKRMIWANWVKVPEHVGGPSWEINCRPI